MWEPALSSPMSWNSMSCTTVPESQSSLESPECGRSAAEATSQTLKRSSAWIQNAYCLMTNHIHLLVETGDVEIGKFMKYMSECYHMRPAKVENLIEEFEKRMDREEYDDAKKALDQLIVILGEKHPQSIALKSEYKIEAEE